mmetsp:Transcript_18982/g.59680  ORF Transcript_18982/g.59680 Transcript_18982/m.59680 type:complete len:304 (-) Transcript_18982:92-1003(-)
MVLDPGPRALDYADRQAGHGLPAPPAAEHVDTHDRDVPDDRQVQGRPHRGQAVQRGGDDHLVRLDLRPGGLHSHAVCRDVHALRRAIDELGTGRTRCLCEPRDQGGVALRHGAEISRPALRLALLHAPAVDHRLQGGHVGRIAGQEVPEPCPQEAQEPGRCAGPLQEGLGGDAVELSGRVRRGARQDGVDGDGVLLRGAPDVLLHEAEEAEIPVRIVQRQTGAVCRLRYGPELAVEKEMALRQARGYRDRREPQLLYQCHAVELSGAVADCTPLKMDLSEGACPNPVAVLQRPHHGDLTAERC